MRSRSTVVAALSTAGATELRRLRSEAPLLVRPTGRDASGALVVHLVAGAAGPLGGDDVSLDLVVERGARLVVRSVAASVAQPGRHRGAPSRTVVRASVAAGGSLDWWPEPLVAVRGSCHHSDTAVELEQGAALRWVDELRLGRHAEEAGALVVTQRVRVAGAPLVVHDVRFDDAVPRVGTHGAALVAITGLVHGSPAAEPGSVVRRAVRAARMPLDASSTAWTGLGDDHERVRAALAGLGLARAGS